MKLKRRPRLQKLWQQIEKNKKNCKHTGKRFGRKFSLKQNELLRKTELNVKMALECLGQLMSYLRKWLS